MKILGVAMSSKNTEPEPSTPDPLDKLAALRADSSTSAEEFKASWRESREIYEAFHRAHPKARASKLRGIKYDQEHGLL